MINDRNSINLNLPVRGGRNIGLFTKNHKITFVQVKRQSVGLEPGSSITQFNVDGINNRNQSSIVTRIKNIGVISK